MLCREFAPLHRVDRIPILFLRMVEFPQCRFRCARQNAPRADASGAANFRVARDAPKAARLGLQADLRVLIRRRLCPMVFRLGQHKRRHTGTGGSASCQPSDDPEDEGASAVPRIWLHAAVEPGRGTPDDDSSLVKLTSSRF